MALTTLAVSLGALVFVALGAMMPAPKLVGAEEPIDTASPEPVVLAPHVAPPVSSVRGPGSYELATDPRMRAAIQGALGSDLPHYSIVVRRLSDGHGVAINADREFYAASTFKLAVLYEVERRRSEGLVHGSDDLQLTDADLSEDLGTISEVPVGPDGKLPISAALRAMVTLSDNSTAVALMHLVGPSNIDETLKALGLQHTSVNTEKLPTTAADMALLMEAIVEGKGMSDESRADMRELLLGQETRTGIPAGLPSTVRVGNKTGTWEGITHDIAFVEAPGGTYVIAVLSDRGWSWDPIARVSKAVYETFTNQ